MMLLDEYCCRIPHFCENIKIAENAHGKGVYLAILSNLFDMDKTSVTGVVKVVKYESVVKIELAQFLDVVGSIFA